MTDPSQDTDPGETAEWREALRALVEVEGPERSMVERDVHFDVSPAVRRIRSY